jgi:hypothetical protein
MSAPSCFVVPAGELSDALAMIVWLPFFVMGVGWFLRYDWDWFFYRRRVRARYTRRLVARDKARGLVR